MLFLTWFNSHFLRLGNLLKQHPVVSLASRLQYETSLRVPIDLFPIKDPFTGRINLSREGRPVLQTSDRVDLENLDNFEREFEADASQRTNRHLGRSLYALLFSHYGIEQQFRMAIGLGIERTTLMPYTKWRLDIPEAPLMPVQPHINRSVRDAPSVTILNLDDSFSPWHRKNVISFTSPSSMGVVGWANRLPDMSRTVGFQKHAVRQHPVTSIQGENGLHSLRIDSMLLISLLKHRSPAVYISENLPNIKELDSVPTRQPNGFESDAVARLISGEDLVIDCRSSSIQMVGAIRAAYQCLECHQLPRGTLLGAFTYRLTPISNTDAESLEPVALSAERTD